MSFYGSFNIRGGGVPLGTQSSSSSSSSSSSTSDTTASSSPPSTVLEVDKSACAGHSGGGDSTYLQHASLLDHPPEVDDLHEIEAAPIFTNQVRAAAESLAARASKKSFSQYGLLATTAEGRASSPRGRDPRIFQNIASPSSIFICGSQGSGKSHTLSCILENCLLPSVANVLPRPLTGIVFHYDGFSSDRSGQPCEAAYISSNPDVKVRVLCAPSNIRTIKETYSRNGLPNVHVEELRLSESDLNTRRMLELMAVTETSPLYMEVVKRILRELRISQQKSFEPFNYAKFKYLLNQEDLTSAQTAPLKQRMDTLESFMVTDQAQAFFTHTHKNKKKGGGGGGGGGKGNDWAPKPGQLTIVDLSCPCITPDMACSLFNIALSLFLEQSPEEVGRVVALDEAHKYLTAKDTAEAQTLTSSLLETIRLQRHLGARVVISTQEPTVSPSLLDLCSVTVVHRFSSPAWLRVLRGHLAGICGVMGQIAARGGVGRGDDEDDEDGDDDDEGDARMRGVLTFGQTDPVLQMFEEIVGLRTGEALLFAPSAVLAVRGQRDGGPADIRRLNHGVLKIRVRKRVTADGGKSIMAG